MLEFCFSQWFFIRKRRPALEDWTGPWKMLQNAMLVNHRREY